jgi:flavin reductase (DIM6/NTAB) family NADH-FMN oxidoreductase RutF
MGYARYAQMSVEDHMSAIGDSSALQRLCLLDETKTAENLARHAECVVNLPAPSMWKMVAIVEILRVHADESFLQDGSHHIDPDKWSSLVYNFRHYFDLSDHELGKKVWHLRKRVISAD